MTSIKSIRILGFFRSTYLNQYEIHSNGVKIIEQKSILGEKSFSTNAISNTV